MKIAGWIFLSLGILSFLGAALKGNNVFGPCFWIALGALFLYLAYRRKNKPEKFPTYFEAYLTSLSLEQRQAAVCLVEYFVGYVDDIDIDEDIWAVKTQARLFLNIPLTSEYTAMIMAKFPDFDIILDTVLTIKLRKATDLLLHLCDIAVRMSGKDQAFYKLMNVAKDMGYSYKEVTNLSSKFGPIR